MRRRGVLAALAALAACAGRPESPSSPPRSPMSLDIRRLHMGDIGTLLLVSLQVGRQPSWWLLDTGATTHAVSREAAQRWGLAGRSSGPVAAPGGTQTLARVALPPLEATPELRWTGQTAAVADLAGYFAAAGAAVDGILGLPVLGAQPVAFDLRRDRLIVGVPAVDADEPPAPGGTLLPLAVDGGLPTLQLALGTRASRPFLFDTGNAGALVLFGNRADADLRRAVAELPSTRFDELGGSVAASHALLERVSAAGYARVRVPATILLGDAPARGRQLTRVAGAAGVALFDGQVVTLDLPRRRLRVEPGGEAGELPGGFGMTLATQAGGAVVVSGLYAAGPAAASGLALGDRLLRIDGRPAPAAANEVWAALAGRPQTRLEFERDGRGRSVVLRRERFFAPLR